MENKQTQLINYYIHLKYNYIKHNKQNSSSIIENRNASICKKKEMSGRK